MKNQKLLLGKYVSAVNDEGEDESKIESYRDVVLPAARPVEDVAIPAYDVYSSGSINVGYLAYNSFNKEDNSELLQLSQFFKDKDITDLVIDLRYNGRWRNGVRTTSGRYFGTCRQIEQPFRLTGI